jgi:hypothetical protein
MAGCNVALSAAYLPVRQKGVVLVFAMLLMGISALITLQSLTSAQIDTRLSYHRVAADEADLIGRGLLAAALDDLHALAIRGKPIEAVPALCDRAPACESEMPRLWALKQQLPTGVRASVSTAEVAATTVARLPEGLASGVGIGSPRIFEVRVAISGRAEAAFAATAAVMSLPPSSGGRRGRGVSDGDPPER